LHACELAEALSIPRIIVPAMPGALSAFGILVSDVVKDYSRTVLWRTASKLPKQQLEREFTALRRSADKDFRSEGWRGALHHQRSVDVRYRGQGYELNVPLSRNLIPDFHRAHQQRYGYSHAEREVELVTLRLRTTMKSPQASLTTGHTASVGTAHVGTGTLARPGRAKLDKLFADRTRVVLGGKKIAATVYAREQLLAGKKYKGPAVITEYSATTVVPPRIPFWTDRAGNLVIQVR
jgi:N-methylhydantoinase A